MFTTEPSLRPLFRGDMAGQVRHLMMALTMVVQSLDALTPILQRIAALGRRHAGYGVQPWHFPMVGTALLATLAYTTLAGAMLAAMQEPVPPAA